MSKMRGDVHPGISLEKARESGVCVACMYRRLLTYLFDKCKCHTLPRRFLPELASSFGGYFAHMHRRYFTAMRSDRGENTTLVCGQAWLAL